MNVLLKALNAGPEAGEAGLHVGHQKLCVPRAVVPVHLVDGPLQQFVQIHKGGELAFARVLVWAPRLRRRSSEVEAPAVVTRPECAVRSIVVHNRHVWIRRLRNGAQLFLSAQEARRYQLRKILGPGKNPGGPQLAFLGTTWECASIFDRVTEVH